MREFANFVCIDWSGAAVARPKGIAVAQCAAGDAAPILLRPGGGWSREAILARLIAQAEAGADVLTGIDFSPSLPFSDPGGFFPGRLASPVDARALWREVDEKSRDDLHLAATSYVRDVDVRPFFRLGRETGTSFVSSDRNGRLRAVERRAEAGYPSSCFNLVGAKQVGLSSLTGMRVLNRLAGRIPFWPFDALPGTGPAIVEIYTSIAACQAGRPAGRTKMRTWEELDAALVHPAIGAQPTGRAGAIDDHSSDAILTAAWMRRAARDPALWTSPALEIARTEGWTFGVPYRKEAPAPV